MEAWFAAFMHWMALPEHGLSTVFLASLLSATLLPMASVPVVLGLVKVNPELFWPALLVATAGNTAGGAISWWMGYGAERAYEHVAHRDPGNARALVWLRRFGPKACLLSWLPFVGDPLCAVAGWLRLPFWPCVAYMAIGKFLRYLVYVGGIVGLFPAPWVPERAGRPRIGDPSSTVFAPCICPRRPRPPTTSSPPPGSACTAWTTCRPSLVGTRRPTCHPRAWRPAPQRWPRWPR
jgi:membrane protein YqaA with SNARE-associated domain